MLFEDWAAIGRVALLALLTYAWLVLVLRAYGKRTLAKLNAFDFVVTVALGSILATALLSPATTWAQAATAFVALSTLQWLVARLSLRWPWFHRLIRSRPRLLLLDGRMLGDAMRAERIAEDDIRAAVRREGRSAERGPRGRARDRRHPERPGGARRRQHAARCRRLSRLTRTICR
ncbi:MAG: DUF421 domain-containing protein [Cypionkella sp.]